MSKIELLPFEILLGAQAGVMRQVENLKMGRKDAFGATEDTPWQMHVEGCLVEMALGKYLGVYWSGKGKLRAPDVGEVDVRGTPLLHGRLMIHKEDPNDRIFWLVCGRNGSYEVKGWIKGIDAKEDKWWSDPTKTKRFAYFVPQDALNEYVD